MSLTTLFVDLNSYFASVEQELRPELRGRPLAVVPVMADTTCCIAASVEAKKFGVRTGTRVGEARRICPELILVRGRPATYVQFHHRILAAAETVLPVRSVHSIDEFSCRLIGAEREPARAEQLALEMKRAIYQRVGSSLRCSIGVAPNRLLAKVASDMQKPDGLVVIRREELPGRLMGLSLTDLPGIGAKMNARLAAKGVRTIQQLLAMSEGAMGSAWESVVGRWWYHALRGDELPEPPSRRRSIGHQHVLPPELRNDAAARGVAIKLLDKAAARARGLGYWARRLSLSVRYMDGRKWGVSSGFPECRDTLTLVESLLRLWDRRPRGAMLRVGVTLDELSGPGSATGSLFEQAREREDLSRTMDAVNAKYGRSTMFLASMQAVRSSSPNRIAFRSIPEIREGDVEREAAEG
jgi:DNA polymerase-4